MELKFLNHECCIDTTYCETIQYDESYFNKYEKMSQSALGIALNSFRKSYVEKFANPGSILDYGTGYGELVLLDTSERWFGYDINPLTEKRLSHRFYECRHECSNICLFDVLEHMRDPVKFLLDTQQGVRMFISIPLWSDNWNEITQWKHWRPKEHFLYASPNGFEELMKQCGFVLLNKCNNETLLGREDIYSFAFQKC